MNTYETTKQKKQINRGVYGLLSLLVIVFGLILFVLQFHDNESDHRHDIANNYHLAISEKGLALLGAIDKTKLWFLDRDINNLDRLVINNKAASPSPLHMGFSRRDEINALNYHIEKIAVEISTIQKQYPDPEFKVISEIFEKKRIKTQLALKTLKPTNLNVYKLIDGVVTPLRSVAHQLQLLHRNAYREIQLSKEAYDWERGVQLIGLICLLVVIGLLSVFWMLRYVRHTLIDLTKAQDEVQYERDFAASLVSTAPVIVLLLDVRGHIQHVNPYFEELTGYHLDEIKGREWFDTFLPARNQDRIRELFQNARQGTPVKGNINPIITRDGKEREIEWYAQPMRDARGAITGVLSIGQDVTERKINEEEIERLASIVKHSSDFIGISDTEGHALFVNDAGRDLVGIRDDEHVSSTKIFDYISNSDNDLMVNEVMPAVTSKGHWTGEINFQHFQNGRKIPVWFDIFRIDDPNTGQPINFATVTQDITERKAAISAMEQSEQRYRVLAKVSPVGIFRTDVEGNCIYANERWCALAGISEAEAQSEGWAQALHPEDRDRVFSEWYKAVTDNITFTTECRFQRPDGKVTWLLAMAEAELDSENQVIGYVGTITDISKRKQVEIALKESEALLERAQSLANVGYWKLIPETGEVTGSDELFEIFGFSRDEATLDKFVEVVHPDDREMDVAAIQHGIEHGESWDIEHRLICRDGTVKWVHAIGEATIDVEGNVVELLGTVQDITVLKKTELALLESELWMKNIYNSLDEAVLVVSPDRELINANDAAVKMFGYSVEEIASNSTELFHVDHQHFIEFGERINQAFSKDKTANFEFEAKRRNGEIFPTEHTVSLLKNPDGETKGIVSVIRDITERNLAEQELRQFKSTLDQTLDCVFMFDEDLRFFYLNEGALQQVGYSREELLSMRPYDIKPEVSEEQFRELIAPLLSREQASINFEVIHEHKNGLQIPVEIFLQYIAPEEESARFVAIVHDISERKLAEQALVKSEARLNEAQRIAKVGAWELDLLTNELAWSDEIFFMFEIDKKEFTASYEAFLNAVHPEDRDAVNTAYTSSLTDQGPYEIEHRLKMKDGRIKYVRESCVSYFDNDGRPLRSVGSVQDITDGKKIEDELSKYRLQLEELVEERTKELRDTQNELINKQDELVRKERLATLGQLTATVSHELRNPLGAMRPSLYVIDKKSDKNDERVQKAIERVDRNIDRCDHIIDELLDFTRITELNRHETRIDEWVETVLSEQNIPKGIRVEKDLSLEGYKISIDADRLRRALINIIENGVHAMLDDNKLIRDKENSSLHIKTGKNKERIEISITDTGSGISKDVLEKIFEPLFSTKGFGVGLGMPTVKQILEQHGGGIEVETKENKGTTIVLWLPHSESGEVAA